MNSGNHPPLIWAGTYAEKGGEGLYPLSRQQSGESGGYSPRHILLLEQERLLLVANEEGSNVTGFDIGEDGRLTPAGIDLEVPGAAFLLKADPAN